MDSRVKNNTPKLAEIDMLFDNSDSEMVWEKANGIIRRISPSYDFTLIQAVHSDVLNLFRGEYDGYCPINTPYHDLPHTLGALLCGVRLMHGVHLSGDHLKDEEITAVVIAILLHDVGYAQRRGEECGTGAQYTQTHVQRSVEFMQGYFSGRNLSDEIRAALPNMILGTDHIRPFTRLDFANERVLMLGRIVATADIVGQMSDRIYLEKLLFLYLEFREAQFGNYRSVYDLLRQTNRFYTTTREKLDGVLGGIHSKFVFHFKETLKADRNYYLESIEKNMAYLAKIVDYDEEELFAMLKRNGVVEKSRSAVQ